MPATEGARQPISQGIPFKRVLLNDPSQLPIDYSSTPGGTLYSTTPGGDNSFICKPAVTICL